MDIKLQLRNFAKLLLIGAVLFTGFFAASHQAVRCVSAKSEPVCQADTVERMFAKADDQPKPESPGYLMAGDACVKAVLPPAAITPKILGAIVGDSQGYVQEEDSQNTIVEYEIQPDDTIAGVAQKFGVSSETVAWANDLAKTAPLKPGQKLIVPPVSGVIHYVVFGDTMDKIAQSYKAEAEEIVAFNELAGQDDIFVGDVLVVPGGRIAPPPVAKKPVASNAKSSPSKIASAPIGQALPQNYFLCPVGPACKKTQGLHFRNAVDLTGGYCGAPIYAAASGTVAKAKTGWNGGAGNNIAVSHMGGAVITHYYHLQSFNVASGQEVKKGDVIGFMGSTGKSTGCHLHFEVIGGTNPFN